MQPNGYPVRWGELSDDEKAQAIDELMEKLGLCIWRREWPTERIEIRERDQDSNG